MRIGLYARVSTSDQEPETQLRELRAYVGHRGWTLAGEYVDQGVSGATDRRPQLDRLMTAARRRQLDGVLVWRLDRLGRSLRHLIVTLDELQALGVAFVSLHDGVDATTPAGRLGLQVLGAVAEFERALIRERVRAGLARAKAEGVRLGRRPVAVSTADLERTAGLSVRTAARALGVSRAVLHRARRRASTPTRARVA